MTKANSTNRESTVPVRGTDLKKVTRRSARRAACNTNSNTESGTDASLQCGAHPAPCTPTDIPQQYEHQPMLAVDTDDDQQIDEWLERKVVLPIAGRGTKDYCEWWREQVAGQSSIGLFGVRLIGDASSPQLFTSMSQNDLAYCRCAPLCVCLFSAAHCKFMYHGRGDLQHFCLQQVGL